VPRAVVRKNNAERFLGRGAVPQKRQSLNAVLHIHERLRGDRTYPRFNPGYDGAYVGKL